MSPKCCGIVAIGVSSRGIHFPLWEHCLKSLAEHCDGIVIRFDGRTGDPAVRARIPAVLGSKLVKLFDSTTRWGRILWREELLRALDDVQPQVVLFPDQDECFGDGIEADIARLLADPIPKGMMVGNTMLTADGADVPLYPRRPHMKMYRWQPGLQYKRSPGFAIVSQYKSRSLRLCARAKMVHYCFYTPDLRVGRDWEKFTHGKVQDATRSG